FSLHDAIPVCRLADLHTRGWILNPDGCGFRASLKRALDAQRLPVSIALDAFSRDVQLQAVVDGFGLGLLPLPLLETSPLRDALDIVNVTDFRPSIDLWLAQREGVERLAEPAQAVAGAARERFAALGAEDAAA
uniref:LysR substrate-binding domain-containing protein n=1 Tax=Burkholderia sp. Ac-20379 TaxID=2703900 RepID=UPI001D60BF80